ncbi:MAG: PAS domain-containing sensor histidine kinase [Alphaproteobacteria bacterium]|nr:PAS domain-containing sensor histidine kinase [Alphaproteobacteria bacterium]
MTVQPAPEQAPDWLQRNFFRVARTSVLSYLLIFASLVAVVVTYLILTRSTQIEPTAPGVLLYIIIVDVLLLMALIALVTGRLVGMWMQRRSGTAGTRLHGRLVTIFFLIAVIPVVLTAGAAAITINLAMEAWFSSGVRSVVDNSIALAETYQEDQKRVIQWDAELMVSDFNAQVFPGGLVVDSEATRQRMDAFLRRQLTTRQLPGGGIFNSNGQEVIVVGLVVDRPSADELSEASTGALSITITPAGGRAVARLDPVGDFYLVLMREVNRELVQYQQSTTEAAQNYKRLQRDRDAVQATFGLMYAIIALLIIFGAIWVGFGVANRLVMPIGRLIGAAERVSEGDLAARVMLADDDDELASLGRAFNRMTAQLQSQRNELVDSHRQAEQRTRFTEAVLSGVSAGVVGLDAQGRADVVNRSALTLLSASREEIVGRDLATAVPELSALVSDALSGGEGRVQSQIDIARGAKTYSLIVTVTRERASEEDRGFVVTFDDITDLIMAQRTSAWADVARRIAHEIKNPLTPIQLSAERLRRKYKKEITTDPEVFEQCTQTIIRQVGDIGRMVDEFSSFARMPQPVMRDEDIGDLIRHAVFLQRVALPQITFALLTPDEPIHVECDGRLVSQALTNVLKNAGEAVRAKFGKEGDEEHPLTDGGRIEIRLVQDPLRVGIEVIDNGIGLPKEDRNRLTEPYVTKRVKGTGLGLAIVKKIMEDHKGALALEDAPKTDETGSTRESGALVRLTFPRRLAVPVKLAGE